MREKFVLLSIDYSRDVVVYKNESGEVFSSGIVGVIRDLRTGRVLGVKVVSGRQNGQNHFSDILLQ